MPAADVADVGVSCVSGRHAARAGQRDADAGQCGMGVRCEARAVLQTLSMCIRRSALARSCSMRRGSARRLFTCRDTCQVPKMHKHRVVAGRAVRRRASTRTETSVRAAVCTAGSFRSLSVPRSFSRSASRRRARTGDSWCCMPTRPPAPASRGGAVPHSNCRQLEPGGDTIALITAGPEVIQRALLSW